MLPHRLHHGPDLRERGTRGLKKGDATAVDHSLRSILGLPVRRELKRRRRRAVEGKKMAGVVRAHQTDWGVRLQQRGRQVRHELRPRGAACEASDQGPEGLPLEREEPEAGGNVRRELQGGRKGRKEGEKRENG